MKINRAALPINQDVVLEEEIDFSSYPFDEHHIRRIDKCLVKVILHEFEDVLQCKISGKAEVIASCSYTLDDVPLKVKFKDELFFSDEESTENNIEYEPRVTIELDPYVLALICDAVPHNVVKPGATLPSGGEGYRVLTEEEFLKEKKNKKNHKFDDLDKIEFPFDDGN